MQPKKLNLAAWRRELEGDVDAEFLLQGIENGFHIVNSSDLLQPAFMHNYRSATNSTAAPIVEKQILAEIAEGRYKIVDKPPTLVSALGAIPKSNSNELRIIHDCSQPAGKAVNDYARLEEKLSYQSLDDATKLLVPGGYSAKVDLKSAYRSVSIHADDQAYMGLAWTFEGHTAPTYMIDTRLPFGSRLAPGIFHRLTQAVRRMMAKRGYDIAAFFDDFFLHEPTFERCLAAVHELVRLLRELGFYIAYDKLEGPARRVTFLGIVIDSELFMLELPQQKLDEFYAILVQFASRKRASLRQLQQLAGRLNWASQVVKGGRCYLRRILDIMKPLKQSHHKVLLPQSFFADIQWWLQFLPVFNGKCLALNHAPVHDVYVDASGTGVGFIFANDWGYCGWRDIDRHVGQFHINEKEILSAVMAARRWAPLWANSRVLFHTDNITARAALRKGSAKSWRIMPYLRELFWLSALFNFTIDAVYIPGHQNDTPDMISRLEQPGYFPVFINTIGLPVTAWHYVLSCLPAHVSYPSICSILPQIRKYLV